MDGRKCQETCELRLGDSIRFDSIRDSRLETREVYDDDDVKGEKERAKEFEIPSPDIASLRTRLDQWASFVRRPSRLAACRVPRTGLGARRCRSRCTNVPVPTYRRTDVPTYARLLLSHPIDHVVPT